jgi:hypothetical protein
VTKIREHGDVEKHGYKTLKSIESNSGKNRTSHGNVCICHMFAGRSGEALDIFTKELADLVENNINKAILQNNNSPEGTDNAQSNKSAHAITSLI